MNEEITVLTIDDKDFVVLEKIINFFNRFKDIASDKL